MKGVAAVQHGPDTGLVHPRGSTNQERTTHDRKSICTSAHRPLWPWPSGLPFRAAQPQPARAQEAPFGLVDWKPIADNPVFAGTGSNTWDRKIRERGYILVGDDGIFHLWYTGYDRDRPDTMSLGHATSRDGTHWTRDPHNPIFTDSWVEDMCVVKQDGTYQMFAEGKNDIAHRLSSRDGVHWTDHGSLDIRKTDGTPIGPGPYGTPTAWFENGTWYLFYERGDQGVWLATSRDLKTWTNVKDDPVLARAPRLRRDSRGAQSGGQGGAYYYAFYHANAQRPWKTGRRMSPARATWCTGRNTQATRSQEQLLEPGPCHNPEGRPALHDAPGRESV